MCMKMETIHHEMKLQSANVNLRLVSVKVFSVSANTYYSVNEFILLRNNNNHYYYYYYSTLASLLIAVHSFLSCAFILHRLIPRAFISSSTSSSHLNFGLTKKWLTDCNHVSVSFHIWFCVCICVYILYIWK
jgi:hypothetical protein